MALSGGQLEQFVKSYEKRACPEHGPYSFFRIVRLELQLGRLFLSAFFVPNNSTIARYFSDYQKGYSIFICKPGSKLLVKETFPTQEVFGFRSSNLSCR